VGVGICIFRVDMGREKQALWAFVYLGLMTKFYFKKYFKCI
jgi:hypothetical protein